MKVFWDPAQMDHDPRFFLQRGIVRRNFERPDRATALLEGVAALGLTPNSPPDAGLAPIEAVHDPAYLALLRDGPADWAALDSPGPEMVPNIHPSPEMLANGAEPGPTVIGRLGWFTADTSCPIGPGTWPAARRAADGALAAAAEAADGRTAYALCRPPGHHAYAGRAGGHCYLNNAAIAAQHLRDRGAARVGVLDIDSHHGNGTQGIFWDRPDVVTVSIHGHPDGYYPWYVGRAHERGAGPGIDANLNLPLPRLAADEAWLEAIRTGLRRLDAVDALVVSLGFDASEHEPLGYLAVTADGFARAGAAIAAAGRPCAIVQEGGYDTERLGPLLERFLGAWRA